MAASTESLADRTSGLRQRRVLVLFGNIPLLGQERGNIQVFHALKQRNVDSLFVTNREWGHVQIQPALDSLGLKWTALTYVDGFRKGMTIGEWTRNIVRVITGSATLVRLMLRYNPSHIHLCNAENFINFLPVLAFTRVPIIYRVGDIPATHRTQFRLLWTKLIARKVSRFVCVSNFVKSSIVSLGVPETKCSVIYSEAPVRFQSVPPGDLQKVSASKTFTVLYVGQLSKEKGIGVLINVAMNICSVRDDVEFVIAGDYEWHNEYARQLRERVCGAGMSERIKFFGYVEAVQDLYRRADLHVLPSVLEDALPNVVIEAKQAGIASVIFPSGGAPELIVHGHDGFVCMDRSESSLSDGIRYYLDHLERVSAHGRNARESLDRLGITQFGEHWDSIYAGD